MGSKLLCLMVRKINDSHGTVSNIFSPYLRDFLLKIWEIYEKWSNSGQFLSKKNVLFFKWVRILPEIDYHYQGASPAPTCIVWHQTLTKTPTTLLFFYKNSLPIFFLFFFLTLPLRGRASEAPPLPSVNGDCLQTHVSIDLKLLDFF